MLEVSSRELTGKNNRAYGFNAGDPLRMQTEAVSQKAVMKIIIRHKRDAAIAGKRWRARSRLTCQAVLRYNLVEV